MFSIFLSRSYMTAATVNLKTQCSYFEMSCSLLYILPANVSSRETPFPQNRNNIMYCCIKCAWCHWLYDVTGCVMLQTSLSVWCYKRHWVCDIFGSMTSLIMIYFNIHLVWQIGLLSLTTDSRAYPRSLLGQTRPPPSKIVCFMLCQNTA